MINKNKGFVIGILGIAILFLIFLKYESVQEIDYIGYSTVNNICKLSSESQDICKEILADKKVTNEEYLNLMGNLNQIETIKEENQGKEFKNILKEKFQ